MDLHEMDSYGRAQVETNNAWSIVRYSVNGRLEFEIARLALEAPSLVSNFGPKALGLMEESIWVDWEKFNDVYIPRSYMEHHTQPKGWMHQLQQEYLEQHLPDYFAAGTLTAGLFSVDELNCLDSGSVSPDLRSGNAELADLVLGPLGKRLTADKKLRMLLEDKAYQAAALRYGIAMVNISAARLNNENIPDKKLKALIDMLIKNYQSEIQS